MRVASGFRLVGGLRIEGERVAALIQGSGLVEGWFRVDSGFRLGFGLVSGWFRVQARLRVGFGLVQGSGWVEG